MNPLVKLTFGFRLADQANNSLIRAKQKQPYMVMLRCVLMGLQCVPICLIIFLSHLRDTRRDLVQYSLNGWVLFNIKLRSCLVKHLF